MKVWVFKGEVLNRDEQPEVGSETSPDDQARKPRRGAKPVADAGDKPRRPVKGKDALTEGAGSEPVATETKGPAKRVRKAGTTDAATS